jgi:hypothetical protein
MNMPCPPLERARARRETVVKQECKLRKDRLLAAARWSHKNEGTPETHEHASKIRQGALARLYLSGAINADQLAWACEIAMAAELIERDVRVRVASLETRVDNGGSGRNMLVEGIMRVRREVAYTHWRGWIPHPKRAILDMLVGEPRAYSTVAGEYRVGKVKLRRLLIQAIDLWPQAMERAEKQVDNATLAAAYAAIL